jgi:hypothetical protein
MLIVYSVHRQIPTGKLEIALPFFICAAHKYPLTTGSLDCLRSWREVVVINTYNWMSSSGATWRHYLILAGCWRLAMHVPSLFAMSNLYSYHKEVAKKEKEFLLLCILRCIFLEFHFCDSSEINTQGNLHLNLIVVLDQCIHNSSLICSLEFKIAILKWLAWQYCFGTY